jgi:hypothetical protein
MTRNSERIPRSLLQGNLQFIRQRNCELAVILFY